MRDFDWRNISYLKHGNRKQKRAHQALSDSGILEALEKYDPVLVSTVNVNLDTEESDLDIICQSSSLDDIRQILEDLYSNEEKYLCVTGENRGKSFLTCSFFVAPFRIEIYAEDTPVERQHAFRHVSIFHRLIQIGGETFRKQIMAYRGEGKKVEEAIATLMALPGDPYQAVLGLEGLSVGEIEDLLRL